MKILDCILIALLGVNLILPFATLLVMLGTELADTMKKFFYKRELDRMIEESYDDKSAQALSYAAAGLSPEYKPLADAVRHLAKAIESREKPLAAFHFLWLASGELQQEIEKTAAKAVNTHEESKTFDYASRGFKPRNGGK